VGRAFGAVLFASYPELGRAVIILKRRCLEEEHLDSSFWITVTTLFLSFKRLSYTGQVEIAFLSAADSERLLLLTLEDLPA
jgi:hypothetical protein